MPQTADAIFYQLYFPQPGVAEAEFERDHASKAVKPDERGVPRHRCSPVVSDDDGFTLFERIEQTNHVTNKVEEPKLVYGLRALRLTVTTHIGSDGMEACLCQCGELMTPRIP